MKKYVIIIVLMGLVLGTFLVNNIIKTQASRVKEFYNSGYILQAMSESDGNGKIETYYFNEEQKYKNIYNTKTEFKDINNKNVITSNENFIHYKDNSISSLKKGVIINLDDIEKDPICYYSLTAGKVLKYSAEGYIIQNLAEELNFKKFIYKISDNKYLISGNTVKIKFNDGTEKIIEDGYIEFEYCDNKIVKLYNKELNYQTVSSEVYIEVDDITLDLGTTIISKSTENKMSLANMVIDSDDNIEIVDLSQEENTKELEEQENTITPNEQTQNNAGGQNGGSTNTSETITNNQSQGVVVEDDKDNVAENEDNSNETYVPQTEENSAPIYRVEEFDVDAISLNARITVNGNIEALVSDSVLKIVNNSTQDIVHEEIFGSTTYNMDITAQNLTPNTEYTLIVEGTYEVGDVNYTKNFVHKIFKTHAVGVTFEKDYFTNSSLSFNVIIEADAKVKSVQLGLFDISGNLLQESDEITAIEGQKSSTNVNFVALSSNTEYMAKIINVLYGGENIESGMEEGRIFKTLKKTPVIQETFVEIDKRNSAFIASLSNITDTDSGIQSYRCEIYNVLGEEKNEPIYVANSSENMAFNIPVDGIKIQRNIKYNFKFIITFYDNEKIVEYEIDHGEIISMDGSEFPTIRFDKEEITYERIKGNIIIEDKGYTIDAYDVFTIQYKEPVSGNVKEIKYNGTGILSIPIDINNLRANTTYSFVLKGKVDLQDGNDPIENCYIDTIIIKTGEPNRMRATFVDDDSDVDNVFAVNLNLSNIEGVTSSLEAETLSGMTISLYSGQSIITGQKKAEVQLKDNNLDEYKSTLKEDFYDDSYLITPQFFGLTNTQLTNNENYIIKISNSHDYTDYKNELPIEENEHLVTIKGYMPELPEDTEDAISVEVIRNRDAYQVDNKLDADTVVGYKITAKFDNAQKIGRIITYSVYDANTNKCIKEESIYMDSNSEDVPSLTLNLEEGTNYGIEDTDFLRRGNSYYFTYEVEVDLGGDGNNRHIYPLEGVLRSETVTPFKQEPRIIMYPSLSKGNQITFKYNCLDVDNAIDLEAANGKYMYAYIGSSLKSYKLIEVATNVGEEYKEITFDNITPGDLKIQISKRLVKKERNELKILSNFYYEGEKQISSVTYETMLADNKVETTIIGDENEINRIAAYSITYSADGVEDFVVPFAVAKQNKLTTSLSDLGVNFLNKDITVKVNAYYDSGNIGYDIQSDYYIYQKSYLSTETPYYYNLKDTNLVEQKEALECIYETSRNTNILSIKNLVNNKSANIELAYSEKGFLFGYNAILQKKIEKEELEFTNNTFRFDLIIPGIKMYNEQDILQIEAGLDNVNINAEIIDTGIFELKDDLIYIDLYIKNGNTWSRHKTIQKEIEEFSNIVKIEGLSPKTNYYIQFYTFIRKTDGTYEQEYLYDLKQEESGRKYEFNTLNEVGVNNINVDYIAHDYDNKDIKITYNVKILGGYDTIKHEIYKWDSTISAYEENPSFTQEFTPMSNDIEKTISANPGETWDFGQKYLLFIKPMKTIQDEEGNVIGYIELWTDNSISTLKHEFTLTPLREPMIMVTATRNGEDTDNKKIEYRITINDDDKIIKDGIYSVQVLDEENKEIIKEENIGIDLQNKEITIENVDFSKKYTMIINYSPDYNNNGIIEEEEENKGKKEEVLQPINEHGVRIGNVSVSTTKEGKVQLTFTDTYRLADIKYINYKVASNTQDFSVNKIENFEPTRPSLDSNYYTYVLDAILPEEGFYFIELQFQGMEGKEESILIDTRSLQYVYHK